GRGLGAFSRPASRTIARLQTGENRTTAASLRARPIGMPFGNNSELTLSVDRRLKGEPPMRSRMKGHFSTQITSYLLTPVAVLTLCMPVESQHASYSFTRL